MMDLKGLIERRLAELQLGPVEAATSAGLERNFIKDLLADKKKNPRADNLARLARALNVTVEELLSVQSGKSLSPEQDRYKSTSTASEHRGKPSLSAVSTNTAYSGSDRGAIPEMDARAGAGNGEVGRVISIASRGIETAHVVRSEWLIPPEFTRYTLGSNPNTTIILEVIGDSMRPTLEPGDRVIVDMSSQWRGDDSVWLIDDGTPKVKRIRLVRGSSPQRVTIMSDNPSIPPEEVLYDEIRIIGRVCGRVSKM